MDSHELGISKMSRFALEFLGWERCSTWGYDDPMNCLFAQLYRNRPDGSIPDGEPDIWINEYTNYDMFVRRLCQATGETYASVITTLYNSVPETLEGRTYHTPLEIFVQKSRDPRTIMAIDQCGIIGLVMEARNNPLYRGQLPRE